MAVTMAIAIRKAMADTFIEEATPYLKALAARHPFSSDPRLTAMRDMHGAAKPRGGFEWRARRVPKSTKSTVVECIIKWNDIECVLSSDNGDLKGLPRLVREAIVQSLSRRMDKMLREVLGH